jgi:anti-anti-sigma factor
VAQLELHGKVEATDLDENTVLVAAHGPIDARMAGELRDVLLPLAGADGTRLLLDLADAHCLEDDILSVVGTAAHLMARRGERMTIVTRSDYTRMLIVDCGLDELVDVVTSIGEIGV